MEQPLFEPNLDINPKNEQFMKELFEELLLFDLNKKDVNLSLKYKKKDIDI